jgi:hypothetical protein
MAEINKMNEQELETVAGGYGGNGSWVTVRGLQTGYLALRTAPNYDYANEIRGSESYNGQPLQITGGYSYGPDGRTYVWVYNPRSGMSGWTNAAFLG